MSKSFTSHSEGANVADDNSILARRLKYYGNPNGVWNGDNDGDGYDNDDDEIIKRIKLAPIASIWAKKFHFNGTAS